MLRYETRNGNDETDIPAEKYMQNNQYLFFFSALLPGGGEILWFSGSGAGLREGLVRLFYIIRL